VAIIGGLVTASSLTVLLLAILYPSFEAQETGISAWKRQRPADYEDPAFMAWRVGLGFFNDPPLGNHGDGF
jgi:hypothetical protein